MLALALPPGPLTLLCLGAHADDLEIGCGGSVLRWLGDHAGSKVWWVVWSGDSARRLEAEESAARLLEGAAESRILVHDHRDGCFPAERALLKDRFEALKRELSPGPDLILTHYRDDRHQDHRTISDLTWETFRSHLVLEYEVPKYDGDLGSPNLFVELPEPIMQRKLDHLGQAFPSQRDRTVFRNDTFRSLMRLRGLECAATYAEGFYLRKALMG